MKRDKRFGPIMIIGRGGIDVEIYKDIETLRIPFNKEQAEYIFKKTKISSLIERDHLDKLLDITIKISTLCVRFPSIKR